MRPSGVMLVRKVVFVGQVSSYYAAEVQALLHFFYAIIPGNVIHTVQSLIRQLLE